MQTGNPQTIPSAITLPEQSRASASKGMWFVFHDGPNVIRAWGSYWTGLERIYFNDDLVVYSAERAEQFDFYHEGNHYRLEFCTRSVAIGQLRCTFIKDGEVISVLRSKRRKVLNVRPIYAHIAVCFAFGVSAGALNLPIWAGVVFIMASCLITLLSNAKTDKFDIEQST